MIKAFRDTWELGIHSYLTYLRDRLLLAKDLLHESGSVFVQISDENLHVVRQIMDEVIGANNFVAVISYVTTSGFPSNTLSRAGDYIVWYGKSIDNLKYNQLFRSKELGDDGADEYKWLRMPHGDTRSLKDDEISGRVALPEGARVWRYGPLTSSGASEEGSRPIQFFGKEFSPTGNNHWKVTAVGLMRLSKADLLIPRQNSLSYFLFADSYPVQPINNIWLDTKWGFDAGEKSYVVQTNQKIVERCLLMTTVPGDLVLDPTCGSGTTAFVAEKWGRRWITCDTSRVAVTLAKQRLLTANYDYFELRYPHEGLRGGFMYKTVPHITLGSIANNPEIDEIYERMHSAIESALEKLNKAVKQKLREWEVPFDFPEGWPKAVEEAFLAFHAARQAMRKRMDDSIAAHAESETLYDQPEKSKTKLRITGPFTVEAVPFATVLSLDESEQPQEADVAIARSGESARQHTWRDELLKTGIRGKGGQMLKFSSLETLPGTICLHATGTLDSGERVLVSFGPEHAALEQRQVEHALHEAEHLRPTAKFIVFCAFTFDPEAAKDIDETKWAGVTLLKAQMNTDLLTDDLKKARSSNQSFWLMGQPDVDVRRNKDSTYVVEVNGFDYFDTAKGELVSGGKTKIAMWLLDTNYDDRSLFPHQVFFPMAGKDDGWKKLKRDIRAELDESQLDKFHGTVSLPFAIGENKKVAVKIVDDRGIESLKVIPLN